MTLAAQAFVSIVPDHDRGGGRCDRNKEGFGSFDGATPIGLSDAVQRDARRQPPEHRPTVASGVGFFGFLVAFFSATSYSRALERMFLKVWDVPSRPAAHGLAVARHDRWP